MFRYLSSSYRLSHGVPQGSAPSPIVFSIFTLLLGFIVRKYSIYYHVYADMLSYALRVFILIFLITLSYLTHLPVLLSTLLCLFLQTTKMIKLSLVFYFKFVVN